MIVTLETVLSAEIIAEAAEKDARRWEKLAVEGESHLSLADRYAMAGARASVANMRRDVAVQRIEAGTKAIKLTGSAGLQFQGVVL